MTTFKEAFAAARKAKGAGKTFTYNGKSYSTDRADDPPKKSPRPAEKPAQRVSKAEANKAGDAVGSGPAPVKRPNSNASNSMPATRAPLAPKTSPKPATRAPLAPKTSPKPAAKPSTKAAYTQVPAPKPSAKGPRKPTVRKTR